TAAAKASVDIAKASRRIETGCIASPYGRGWAQRTRHAPGRVTCMARWSRQPQGCDRHGRCRPSVLTDALPQARKPATPQGGMRTQGDPPAHCTSLAEEVRRGIAATSGDAVPWRLAKAATALPSPTTYHAASGCTAGTQA